MPVFAPIDAVGLTTLLIQAGSWLDEVVRHTKRKAQFAGQTLYYLGTTIAALETVENELRGILAPFARFDETWSLDERAAAFDRISAWVHDFTVTTVIERNLPAVRDALDTFDRDSRDHYRTTGEHLQFPGADDVRVALGATLMIANWELAALRDTGELGRTELFTFPDLRRFWRAMRDARTPADVDEVARQASFALHFAREVQLEDGRYSKTAYSLPELFGKARVVTLRAHPSLPRPVWSDPLS